METELNNYALASNSGWGSSSCQDDDNDMDSDGCAQVRELVVYAGQVRNENIVGVLLIRPSDTIADVRRLIVEELEITRLFTIRRVIESMSLSELSSTIAFDIFQHDTERVIISPLRLMTKAGDDLSAQCGHLHPMDAGAIDAVHVGNVDPNGIGQIQLSGERAAHYLNFLKEHNMLGLRTGNSPSQIDSAETRTKNRHYVPGRKRKYQKTGMYRKDANGQFMFPSSQRKRAMDSTMVLSSQVPFGEGKGAMIGRAAAVDWPMQLSLETLDSARQKEPVRYWSEEEHNKFLDGIDKFGARNYKILADFIGSRTPTQVRTHLQKYLIKLGKLKAKARECGDQAAADAAALQDSQASASSHGHLTIAPHHLHGTINMLPVDMGGQPIDLSVTSVADAGAGGTELNLALSSLSTGAALPLPQAQFAAETVQRAVAAGAAVAELD